VTTAYDSSASPVLAVRDLSVDFIGSDPSTPPARVLQSVGFELQAGEILGIVGESGCGKTTLALSLLRLLAANGRIRSGQILLRGRDLLDLSETDMARLRWKEMSMIFQGAMNALNPLHTVADQIGEAVRRHEPRTGKVEIRHRVTELLERVGIPAARRSQYPHQFSGGMRQRVMIAMALACNPPVIIADEPTTALDVLNQARILELLSELRDRLGLAVLLISHDLGVIAELCDTTPYARRAISSLSKPSSSTSSLIVRGASKRMTLA
jgi:peptide/nickel transport system ATP-binding protein